MADISTDDARQQNPPKLHFLFGLIIGVIVGCRRENAGDAGLEGFVEGGFDFVQIVLAGERHGLLSWHLMTFAGRIDLVDLDDAAGGDVESEDQLLNVFVRGVARPLLPCIVMLFFVRRAFS